MITIGNNTLPNNVFLAPMSGISDLPFRRAVLAGGAGLVVSEMVASEELARARPDVVLRASVDQQAETVVIQLAGREAYWMAEGARLAQGLGAQMVDINMGCPARQVTGALSGSALMRDVDHALSLIEATVQAVTIPVSLKMRLGWDHQSLNAPEIARKAEDAGVQLLSVHGRTRQQFYKGVADWRAVQATKAAVSIPVAVNGDIMDAASAQMALAQSGADAVMMGRAAEGQPWLLGQVAKVLQGMVVPPLSLAQKARIACRHYEETIAHYRDNHMVDLAMGEVLGLKTARKHVAAYIEKLDRPLSVKARKYWRGLLCRAIDPVFVEARLEQLFLDDLDRLEMAAV